MGTELATDYKSLQGEQIKFINILCIQLCTLNME